jgi:ubiquinone/menaquinone biosynthesis C-methylase UbiE
MTLDPLARRGFASAAAAYERGRPGYAPRAVALVCSELRLDDGSRVLDLAAGTGQLSRLLVGSVGSLVAVEPSPAMRGVLREQVPRAAVLDGEAEQLPLPAASVDAIVVGEAFHWFSGARAVEELARVLRPGGGLALLWNVLLAFEPPWDDELRAIVARRRAAALRDEQRYSSGLWRRALERSEDFEALASASAEHEQQLDREGLLAQIASWSYIASLPEPDRAAVLDSARTLLPAAGAVRWRTDVHWTRRVSRAAGP